MLVYSFCEASWAGPLSPWHIRKLTSVGKKLGGGVDTNSLCGRINNGRGWDLSAEITDHHLDHSCKDCVEIYKKESDNGC